MNNEEHSQELINQTEINQQEENNSEPLSRDEYFEILEDAFR